jgi:dihydrofolate reductase
MNASQATSSFSGERKRLALVVAIANGRVIGKDGGLPWRIPEDMRHFRRTTVGHAIIMGRKTFESLGRPLPERTNIVVTRDRTYVPGEGVIVCHSFEEALARAWQIDAEPRVIGGASIYAAAMPFLTRAFLTEVRRDVEGDTYFPETSWEGFEVVARTVGEESDVSYVEMARAERPAAQTESLG